MPRHDDPARPPSLLVNTRRAPWLAAAAAALVVCGQACSPPAPVVQGKVLPGSADRYQLVVEDELRPGAPPVRLDTSGAEIGAPPVPGDRVRVVYRASGGINRALAVMNLTRQPEPAAGHN